MIELIMKYSNENKILLNINDKSKEDLNPLILAINNNDIDSVMLILDYVNKNDIKLNINEKDKIKCDSFFKKINNI
jgi:hypothetical protein